MSEYIIHFDLKGVVPKRWWSPFNSESFHEIVSSKTIDLPEEFNGRGFIYIGGKKEIVSKVERNEKGGPTSLILWKNYCLNNREQFYEEVEKNRSLLSGLG